MHHCVSGGTDCALRLHSEVDECRSVFGALKLRGKGEEKKGVREERVEAAQPPHRSRLLTCRARRPVFDSGTASGWAY